MHAKKFLLQYPLDPKREFISKTNDMKSIFHSLIFIFSLYTNNIHEHVSAVDQMKKTHGIAKLRSSLANHTYLECQ